MKIAIQGCAHGELDNIYSTIEYIEKQNNINIDLLLCCGDFQATRNLEDLKCLAAPPKYRSLCTFYKYYSGEKVAPKLTIFIGGNHEASNYLQELPYGGWVAPNIYYLGYAGVVNFGGIRIAGLSGIFKGIDFARGRYEKPPYNDETLRSCYHIRNLDVFRLKQLSSPIQIMLSHDWPAGIVNHGNVRQLLKNKPFFKEDIDNNSLGSKPTAELLDTMKPDYWFAAHLHVKFAALVKHNTPEPKSTKFLALDKCLPRRRFLQVLDVPHNEEEGELELKYDLEWLTILHLTNHLLSVKKLNTYMPGPGSNERWSFQPTEDEMDVVLNKMGNNLTVPKNFAPTAPAHNSNVRVEPLDGVKINSQTVELCNKLCIDDPIWLLQKDTFSNSNCSLNMSNFDCSSFVGVSDSEVDVSASSINSESQTKQRSFARTPLKLPVPSVQVPDGEEGQEGDFRTSTPIVKASTEDDLSAGKTTAAEETKEPTVPATTGDESVTGGEPAPSQPKKFRRRNMAMYANTEEDDE